MLDLDSGQARRSSGAAGSPCGPGGDSWTVPSGSHRDHRRAAHGRRPSREPSAATTRPGRLTANAARPEPPALPAVDAALAAGDVRPAVAILLRLDASAATDAERETVRAAIARLGAYAADAPVDRGG